MTTKNSARLAGFMYLFYIATGIGGMALFAPATRGSGTGARLASVAAHPLLTRFGAVYAIVMAMNAIVLGVALYALTCDYDRDLAVLALACRMTEGVIAAVGAIGKRALLPIAAAALSKNAGDAAAATALGSVVFEVQGLGTLIGATFFAIGSTIFCCLFLRARSVPVALSSLGVAASALLVIVLPLQLAGLIEGNVAMWSWAPMAVFEIAFALWLLVKGVDVSRLRTVTPAEA